MEKFSFPRITGLFVDTAGNGIVGGSAGDYFNSTYHNWNANMTHVVAAPIGDGSMTLQYGGEFRLLQEADGNYGNQSGQFDFNANWSRRRYNTGETGSGSALASFLLGMPSGGNFPRTANRFSTQYYYGFFFQDNWRATKRLTVNLGLRWDYQRPFSLLAAYTFSKLFEDTSFWGPEISGPIPEHKLGGEDRPHKLSLAPIYELPFGRHKKFFSKMPKLADAIMGGWQLTGQFVIQSGAPVVFGTDSFYDGKDFHLSRGDRTLTRWFDTSHFVKFPNANDDISLYPAWTGVQNLPGANYKPSGPSDPRNGVYADFGNYVRRYPTRWANVRASRVNVLNLGIYKNFRLREDWKIQVRGEAFNAFNHPRFGLPNTDPASANFGVVDPSQLNLGVPFI